METRERLRRERPRGKPARDPVRWDAGSCGRGGGLAGVSSSRCAERPRPRRARRAARRRLVARRARRPPRRDVRHAVTDPVAPPASTTMRRVPRRRAAPTGTPLGVNHVAVRAASVRLPSRPPRRRHTEIRVRAAEVRPRARAREKRGRGDGAPAAAVAGGRATPSGILVPIADLPPRGRRRARHIARVRRRALPRPPRDLRRHYRRALAAADTARRPAASERPDAPPSRPADGSATRRRRRRRPTPARARAPSRAAPRTSFFAACAAARPPRVDLASLRRVPSRGSRMYSSLLGACARAGDLPTATRAFRLYARATFRGRVRVLGSDRAAGKAGKLETAAEAPRRGGRGGVRRRRLSAFVDACARQATTRAARRWRRARAGVSPNVRTYLAHHRGARANDLPAAKAALAALK